MPNNYYGLPPEEGFSYANYLCPSCGFQFVSNRGQEMYCPSCGSAVNFVNEVAESELPQNIREVGKCTACTSVLATSADDMELKKLGTVYCPQCGATVELTVKFSEETNQKPQGTVAAPELFRLPDQIQAPEKTKIVMTLHECPDKGPFWNIIIDGNPVARVYLQDQPQPEEIKPLFLSEQFPQVVQQTVAQFGVQEALASINARYYALDENAVRAKVEEEVRKEYEERFQERVLALRNEFKEAVALALEGMAKNFFQDTDNPLKAALYTELVKAGVDNPTRYIEAAFERSATQFFDVVLDKALELMSKSEEVRREIAAMIKAAAPIQPKPAEETPNVKAIETMDTAELKNRLVKGNFAFLPPEVKTEGESKEASQTVANMREALRSLFRRY